MSSDRNRRPTPGDHTTDAAVDATPGAVARPRDRSYRRDHDDAVAAAVHEAGHVVGEYALGHRVRRACLDRCGGGRTSPGWWAWRPLADAVTASLAGPSAEALWRDTPLRVVLAEDACQHDRTRVDRWLAGRDIEAHARRAGELVACGWPLVARVAAILAVRRRITHRDLRRLAISLPTPVPAPGPGGPSGKNAHRAGLPTTPMTK